MTERNVGRKPTLSERFWLWGLRRRVEAARKRLLEGRGDLFDKLLVMGWDDPDALAEVAKAQAETGITAREAVEAIHLVVGQQSSWERTE